MCYAGVHFGKVQSFKLRCETGKGSPKNRQNRVRATTTTRPDTLTTEEAPALPTTFINRYLPGWDARRSIITDKNRHRTPPTTPGIPIYCLKPNECLTDSVQLYFEVFLSDRESSEDGFGHLFAELFESFFDRLRDLGGRIRFTF